MKTTTRQPLTFNDMAVAFGIVKGDDRAKAPAPKARMEAAPQGGAGGGAFAEALKGKFGR